jgi:hypothetical protein
MKIIIFIIIALLFSTKAFAKNYFWKCYDDMLMSTITNKVQSVEKNKFKTANVYVDTKEGFLKYWQTKEDLVKSFSEKKPIEFDFMVKKILINDEMIVATHKPFKDKHPNEYNIFNLDLKNKKLVKVTAVNNERYTKYFDCEDIPLN